MESNAARLLRTALAAAVVGLACVALLWLALPPGSAGASGGAGATAGQKAQQ